jgi:hypothetical protein
MSVSRTTQNNIEQGSLSYFQQMDASLSGKQREEFMAAARRHFTEQAMARRAAVAKKNSQSSQA